MKPFGFFTRDKQVIPIFGKKPSKTGISSLPVRSVSQAIPPKKELVPEKYKELSKSYAIGFGKHGKDFSKKATKFAYQRAKKFAEEKKLKEKAKEDIKKDLKNLINFRSKKEEDEIEKLLTDDNLTTKSPEELQQEIRKLLREKDGKKKFDIPFKVDTKEEVVGGDAQTNELITNRGKRILAPQGYFGGESKQVKRQEETPEEKKEVVDMYLTLLNPHKGMVS